jgi:hypothetical protein
MSNFEPLRYHFHASGYALSGHFHRPVDVPIAAQASLALPIEGGQAHSGVEAFAIPRIAAFDAAQTHLSGSFPDDNTATSSVTVVVEGLSILDFLTVDRMVTRLTGEHDLKQKNGESHIIALGSHFEGLKLGGHEVKVTLRHDLLLEARTFADLKKGVKDDKKSGKIVMSHEEVLLCSLVEKIETDLPGAIIEGHTIRVPHFGQIALAEVFAGKGIRTLTMIRFHLGSPDGGSGSSGSGSTNGQPPKSGN